MYDVIGCSSTHNKLGLVCSIFTIDVIILHDRSRDLVVRLMALA